MIYYLPPKTITASGDIVYAAAEFGLSLGAAKTAFPMSGAIVIDNASNSRVSIAISSTTFGGAPVSYASGAAVLAVDAGQQGTWDGATIGYLADIAAGTTSIRFTVTMSGTGSVTLSLQLNSSTTTTTGARAIASVTGSTLTVAGSTVGTPVTVAANSYAALTVNGDYAADGTMVVYSVTLNGPLTPYAPGVIKYQLLWAASTQIIVSECYSGAAPAQMVFSPWRVPNTTGSASNIIVVCYNNSAVPISASATIGYMIESIG